MTYTHNMSKWIVAAALSLGAQAAEKVTLQLKWVPQAQFAGYYAALDLGLAWDHVLEDIAKRPYITVGFTAGAAMTAPTESPTTSWRSTIDTPPCTSR